MQLYERLYSYIYEYQDLVYRYYSKHAIAFLIDYYNIDKENTIWDNIQMDGGSYERIGNLSGQRFTKYKMLPVYFIESIPETQLDGTEYGLNKMNETTLVIPSSYGITPIHGSFIKLDQNYLMQNNDYYPVFMVEGIEKSVNTELTFWKLKIKTFQSKIISEVEEQVDENYIFLDYDKKIHTLDNASFITKMMYKNSLLKKEINNKYYNNNSGYYLL